MCGIAGFVDFGGHQVPAAQERVRTMTETLTHRGPDAEGYYVDEHAALGHRRLSIIDIAGGAQPMATSDNRLQIVFNGQIYNFLELRNRLETSGHVFRTRSDTEVILLGYRQWGEHVVEMLNGMFAFAIWDAPGRCLFLARDRVGKKPLYFIQRNGDLAFASELKALAAGAFIEERIDPEALDCYFTFGYIPTPRTIYRGVQKLRPAHSLSASQHGTAKKRYWQLSFADKSTASIEQATDEFEFLLDEAVQCRLMSEVPLGAFLSGGLDSGLVVAAMSKSLSTEVLTNSIGFRDSEFDELPFANRVVAHLQTDHREFIVDTDAASVIDAVAWHCDEPFADASVVPTWHVCRMARENVTVALSGDGGDEGFGGYTFRYLPHLHESRLRAKLPAWLRAPLFGVLGSAWPLSPRLPKPLRLKTILENLAVGDAEAFSRDLAWLRPQRRRRLYRNEYLAELKGFDPFETVLPLYADSDARDPVGKSQATDIAFYLTDDVLVKVDRMSMAHSLEVRCPLLDHRVLEFAASLPVDLRIRGNRGKLVLRRLAERRLPGDLLRLPKRGFSIPTAKWLRADLRPLMDEVVRDSNSVAHSYLDEEELKVLWHQHQKEKRDHSVFLWALLMLHRWQRRHLEKGPETPRLS